MAVLRIHGPARLVGTVTVAGSKNATLPLIAAAILCERPFTLQNVPWVKDVGAMLRLLTSCGGSARWSDSRAVEIEPPPGKPATVPDPGAARSIRASFCLLGPLLARCGQAVLPLPGGCRIGPRPVDRHLEAMRRLGAEIVVQDGVVRAHAKQLRGAVIHLATRRGPTVTGTCNAMLAAAGAVGETILFGAACEPEVVSLGRFLQACGVTIQGLGTSTLVIRGAPLPLRPPQRFHIIPDRIEAATWMCAAAATGGEVTVCGALPEHLTAPVKLLRRIGCAVETSPRAVTVAASRRPLAFLAVAQPYPGLATDVQAQLTTLATAAHGESVIRDAVFPTRFQHVAELRKMGAIVQHAADRCVVRGPRQLNAAPVHAVDLRASAALVIAALRAEGITEIHGLSQLERGYDDLPRKLRLLGVHVQADRHQASRQAA